MALSIDVVSDVVCPWCYIGKRRLESALELYRRRNPGAAEPGVSWHAFQLNPDLPREGMDRAEYVARKFGAQRGSQMYSRVASVGSQVGIPFAFDRVQRQPNTLAAHSLIALAGHAGKQEAATEAFFRAYFIEGRDLTDDAVLEEVAAGAGLERDAIRAQLASDDARADIAREDRHARELGISGVPFFIFNRRIGVSGAQEPQALLEAMLEAEKQPAEPPEPG